MEKPLRPLLVEDSTHDTELLLEELRRSGFDVQFQRVETAEAMSQALKSEPWDVILCDYALPRFDARSAFTLMQTLGFDLPFIIVSGTIGEETAIEAMRFGFHDYFVKDKLGPRLAIAIEREIREAGNRSERKRLQEQLLISDRMVSMGTLAAGVAHEINNPLASVMANLDLAVRDLAALAQRCGPAAELTDAQEELHDAREAAQRIRNIVRDLKIFSRPDETNKSAVDVQRIMESTLRMAWNEIRHRARLVKNYSRAPRVEACESRLGQVFLNLIVNAAQAIAEGRAEDNEIRITIATDATGWVTIEIADTGSGIPPEVLGRLFTPFFTTKPVGVGTGLGLSICQRIVTELGGSINVHTEVGQGTSFQLRLPPAPPAASTGAAGPSAGTAKRRGRVLVVDDEPMIAKAVERTLSDEHDVITVGSAEAVLLRIGAGERFDVILCDLMMPQMTGMDLHAELTRSARDQAARMIFLTGGAFTPRARVFLDETPNQRIEKPFDGMQLRAVVNDRVR